MTPTEPRHHDLKTVQPDVLSIWEGVIADAAIDFEPARVRDVAVAPGRELAEADAHSRCRHHDGTCSEIVDDNERMGEELTNARHEVGRLRAALREIAALPPMSVQGERGDGYRYWWDLAREALGGSDG